MPFVRENHIQTQDVGKLKEVDHHELLKTDDHALARFTDIKALGELMSAQEFNKAFVIAQGIPQSILKRHLESGNTAFFVKVQVPRFDHRGKLEAGTDFYPATAQVTKLVNGQLDLVLHLVPVPWQIFEKGKYERYSEAMLALAAAAATAPHFLMAFETGIASHHHHDTSAAVTEIEPGHSAPLAVIFGAFDQNYQTLNSVIKATSTAAKQLSIKSAAHVHEQDVHSTSTMTAAAAQTKLAGGVKVHILHASDPNLRSAAIHLQTTTNELGKAVIVSLEDVLRSEGLHVIDKSLVAIALGVTSEVVGEDHREQTMAKILDPRMANQPLVSILK